MKQNMHDVEMSKATTTTTTTTTSEATKDPFPTESVTHASQVSLDIEDGGAYEPDEPDFEDEPAMPAPTLPAAPIDGSFAPPLRSDEFFEIAPVAALGQPGGERLQAPVPVMALPLSIQRGFRIKMLTILLLQLVFTMGLSIALRLASSAADEDAGLAATGLGKLFPRGGLQTLLLGVICVALLPLLSAVRDLHPWNMICTALWSALWATFIAAASLPGGLVRSHVLFVLFGSATLGVAVLLVCSTFTSRDAFTGERRLWSFWTSGWVAYFVMLSAAIAFGTQTGHLYETPGHFVSAMLAATM